MAVMTERIAMIKTAHVPMRVVWDVRGEDDGRPWTLNAEGGLHDWWCRYKSESVIELTDVPKMVVDYTNIREVLDFMGVPEGQFAHTDPPPCTTVYNPMVRLGYGSRVWRRKDCSYILGPNDSVFQLWTTPEGIADQLSKMIVRVELP